MEWIIFSYSLPSQANTPRVTLWRRLRRLGASSPTGSVYILPAFDDCVESFQWLAQEIQQAEGDALVMRVSRFEGMDDGQLTALFSQARGEDYAEISVKLAVLERQIEVAKEQDTIAELLAALSKLQKLHADVARIDYFQCPQGTTVAAQLNRLRQQLVSDDTATQITTAVITQYQDKRWVTRPRPHVDRLACAWLIRRYIDCKAIIRYATDIAPGEIGFDMDGAEFSHQDNLCTFEVMLKAFKLKEVALLPMAEIVHEIDLRDGRYQRPETAGIEAILRGWLLTNLPDNELELHGIALFEGLYAAFSHTDKAY